MKFDFSKHAIEQMELREIDIDVAKRILIKPDQIIEELDKRIYQSISLINDKPCLIRIFVNKLKIPNLVITVYKTSKISKYYEGEI